MSASKKKESQAIARVARILIHLSGKKWASNISIYDLAISEALKATGQLNYSGSSRSFIKANIDQLKAYCSANAKRVRQIKEDKKQNRQERSATRSASRVAYVAQAPSVSDRFVASDAFLSSFEWRRVRMMALKKYGPVCMCCGASPATGAVMNVDHIKPRKLFPQLALDVDNLQILCHECNHGKGNWDMTDWRGVDELPLGPQEYEHIRSIVGGR
jgi:5-methylcytosine-specific restriction endonuclease McrA